jgi:hypothetical protein
MGAYNEYFVIDLPHVIEKSIPAMSAKTANDAIELAKRYSKEYDNDQVILQVVSIVKKPSECELVNPVFDDSEKQPAAPVPAYAVGDEVEVTGYVSDEKDDSDNWHEAFVNEVRGERYWCKLVGGPYCGATVIRLASQIRRPAAKPEFKFGDRVRVGVSSDGEDFSKSAAVYVYRARGGYHMVALEKRASNYFFPPDQVFPLF